MLKTWFSFHFFLCSQIILSGVDSIIDNLFLFTYFFFCVLVDVLPVVLHRIMSLGCLPVV